MITENVHRSQNLSAPAAGVVGVPVADAQAQSEAQQHKHGLHRLSLFSTSILIFGLSYFGAFRILMYFQMSKPFSVSEKFTPFGSFRIS